MAPAWARIWLVSGENSRFSDGTAAKTAQIVLCSFVYIVWNDILDTMALVSRSPVFAKVFLQGFFRDSS